MSSSQLHVIKTLWSTIESYLDLSSTVTVAQTCRGLHDEIVDADTRRIKVSRLTDRFHFLPNNMPHILNNLHWPSLRSVELRGFSATESALFVSQIGYANNLESLHLDMSGMVDHYGRFDGEEEEDRGDTVEWETLLELIGRNLSRCTKFRDLGIVVEVEHYCPDRMKSLMLALTSVLVKRGDTMNGVQLDIRRSDPDTEEDGFWEEEEEENARDTLLPVATNFFRAILSCPNLHVLEMNIPEDVVLSDALLGAAGKAVLSKKSLSKRQKLQGTGGQCLHRLLLNVGSKREVFDVGAVADAKALLDYFSGCEELESLVLNVPRQVWEAHSDAVANILHGKQHLSAASFSFSNHEDDDGKILEMLREATMDGKKCKIADLEIRDLFNVEGGRLLKLLKDVKVAGGDSEGWSVGRGDPNAETLPDRVDVRTMWIAHKENCKQRKRDLKRWKEFNRLRLSLQRSRAARRQVKHRTRAVRR